MSRRPLWCRHTGPPSVIPLILWTCPGVPAYRDCGSTPTVPKTWSNSRSLEYENSRSTGAMGVACVTPGLSKGVPCLVPCLTPITFPGKDRGPNRVLLGIRGGVVEDRDRLWSRVLKSTSPVLGTVRFRPSVVGSQNSEFYRLVGDGVGTGLSLRRNIRPGLPPVPVGPLPTGCSLQGLGLRPKSRSFGTKV